MPVVMIGAYIFQTVMGGKCNGRLCISLDIFAMSFELIQEFSMSVDTPEPLSFVLSLILKDKICLYKRNSMSIPMSVVQFSPKIMVF